MSQLTLAVIFMLLNGWFAKVNFERGSNTWAWIALFFSAWELAHVFRALDSLG
jgi:hypothetical protein